MAHSKAISAASIMPSVIPHAKHLAEAARSFVLQDMGIFIYVMLLTSWQNKNVSAFFIDASVASYQALIAG